MKGLSFICIALLVLVILIVGFKIQEYNDPQQQCGGIRNKSQCNDPNNHCQWIGTQSKCVNS